MEFQIAEKQKKEEGRKEHLKNKQKSCLTEMED